MNQNYQPPNQYMNQQPQMNPHINAQGNTGLNNQLIPNMINTQKSLRSMPVMVTCPSCNVIGTTRTVEKCSFLSTCLCICTSGMFWVLVQACRGKDINCTDAEHYCSSCQQKIGDYYSC